MLVRIFFLNYSVVLLGDTYLEFNLKIPPLGLICSLVQVGRIRVRVQITGLTSQLHTSEN